MDAKGFQTLKRSDLRIEVGHAPTLDLSLSMGSEATVVEVTSATPQIDVTTTTTNTNITEDVVQNIPHGTSFQSAIQFAPLGAQRTFGGHVAVQHRQRQRGDLTGQRKQRQCVRLLDRRRPDSENSYLVEGQETANLIGGYSHTNVPFDFIQEMVMDTSGIQAEHGGALGGVVNVIMDKGSNQIHGAVWMMAGASLMNGSPRANPRYDPNGAFSPTADVTWQQYQPKKYHTSDFFPGSGSACRSSRTSSSSLRRSRRSGRTKSAP